MSTAKRISSNRLNAVQSTGPRTPHGKRRSSKNSYKHGFASRQHYDAAGLAEREAIASHIAGNRPGIVGLAAASAADCILRRREIRVSATRQLTWIADQLARIELEVDDAAEVKLVAAVATLSRISRYELRASSAFRTALRQVRRDAAAAASTPQA